jgi:hypothetical protein
MTYNPHKRDSSWKRVAPGLYMDPAGNGHVFPNEIFAEISRLHPEVDYGEYNHDYYKIIVESVQDFLRKSGCQPARIIHHNKEGVPTQ